MLTRQGIEYREQPADAAGITWYQVRRCPFHDDGRDFECGVGQKLPHGPYAGKCFHPEGEGKGWQEWKRALRVESRWDSHDRAMVTTGSDPCSSSSFPQTDAGNAELFAHLYADRVRYDHRRGIWFMWDGHHWRQDGDGEVTRLAIAAARHRYQVAPRIVDTSARKKEADFAIQSENRTRIDAMLELAQCQIPISTEGESWNPEPMHFGVANGVIDLRTGILQPGRPADLVTYFTDVSFDRTTPCPRWEQFLAEIFPQDEDLMDWIWRVVGYLLTANTTAQCFFLCYGTGANGKSVFLNVLRALLGRYAYNAPFATFESQARSQIPNDLAAMVGRRLVTASETNEGSRLNEARVKMLTGRDPVTARFLNREFFTFVPVAKYFLAVNHKPLVKDYSYGFWRRVRLIPFLAQFRENADPLLEDTLLDELPGVLAWAVEGCLEGQRRGLGCPPGLQVLGG
jgi:putative DNA primase/helicase